MDDDYDKAKVQQEAIKTLIDTGYTTALHLLKLQFGSATKIAAELRRNGTPVNNQTVIKWLREKKVDQQYWADLSRASGGMLHPLLFYSEPKDKAK